MLLIENCFKELPDLTSFLSVTEETSPKGFCLPKMYRYAAGFSRPKRLLS